MKKAAVLTLVTLLVGMLFGPISRAEAKDKTPDARPETLTVSPDNLWENLTLKSVDGFTPRVSVRRGFYSVAFLNESAMTGLLATAPVEGDDAAKNVDVRMALPMPDGTFQSFRIWESSIMERELAAEFPEIRTFVGQGIDDPTATVRFDQTPLGFHAQVLAAGRTVYVDPYAAGDTAHYISYDKKGLRLNGRSFECLVDDARAEIDPQIENDKLASYSNGGTLRTYRLANACTGEYATAVCNHNGVSVTVANTMSQITTTINRVVGVYEREVSIRLVLVANNSSIVYTNASTDPYTNTNPSSLLSQNTSTCNSVIGSGNFDIGHVFSTGGGGLAGLGVVCGTRKAEGETGSSAPYGDGFDIDYVAHEMGHQFGGNHTFIGTVGSCSGNGNASTAYERGSGSTIQAYAGICGTNDLQPHSDDYFHSISLNEITNYVAAGGNCSSNTSTGNSVPSLPALTNFTAVPVNTQFTLTAPVATDANGDTLTYCWEDWQTGSSCLFRPTAPTTNRARTFGNVANPTSGNTAWEVLPTSATTKTFRCTVRDNRAGGGAYTSATMTVAFVAGAFSVSSPNTAVSWAGNSTQTVTWTKGGSTAANVKISLSTDGGANYTTVVASTANDGSEAITVPNTPSSTCRVRVEPTDNVYFDFSDVNFTITTGGSCSYSISPTSASVAASASTGSVSVTAGASCSWTASSNDSWLTVTSGASGTGNGSVGYSVAANTGAARSGSLTIAGQSFSVSQAAGSTGCTSNNGTITVNAAAAGGSLDTTDCTSTIRTGGRYYDNYSFTAAAGTTYTITMNASFDTYLHLLDTGGTSVAFDDDGNGGTNSKIVYTPSSGGTYTVHATSYAAGATGAYTVQVTAATGGTELLTNGGFDTGALTPWVGASRAVLVNTASQAGGFNLKLLGAGSTGSGSAYQSVAGFNGATKTLRFYLKMSSGEGTGTAYDFLYVRLKNTSGTTVSTLATYDNRQKATYANWVLVTLTVPATALTNYRIAFEGTEDVSLQTTFFVDSVSIQ